MNDLVSEEVEVDLFHLDGTLIASFTVEVLAFKSAITAMLPTPCCLTHSWTDGESDGPTPSYVCGSCGRELPSWPFLNFSLGDKQEDFHLEEWVRVEEWLSLLEEVPPLEAGLLVEEFVQTAREVLLAHLARLA